MNLILLQAHLHITLSSSLPLTTLQIFQTVQNFVTEKKIGEVLWFHKEQEKMEMGIVMKKENAGETMKKIKEHLVGVGVSDVGFVVPLRSKFDEEYVRRNYKLEFLK